MLPRAWPQVSEKERKMEYDYLFKDVASVLADKCVNPNTNRPYTLSMLERAIRDMHFNPDPKKSAKQQALEVCATNSLQKLDLELCMKTSTC